MPRENPVPTDFLGLCVPGTPCCRHEDLALNRGRTGYQFGCLYVVQSDSSVADPGASSATRRLQAKIQESAAEKQRPVVLVFAFKDLEGLEIGVDSRETRDCDPMEEEEISRALVENVSGQDGQTGNPR